MPCAGCCRRFFSWSPLLPRRRHWRSGSWTRSTSRRRWDAATVKAGDGIAYSDGLRRHLDVYAPEARGEPAPVVFFIYGGAWSHGERADYQFVGRAFASRGFVTVIADYRLAAGGEVSRISGGQCQRPALGSGQYRRLREAIRPRLFIAGHSAGAYNAVMLALDPWFLSEYGVTLPIRAVAALSGPYDFYPFEYNEVRDVFGAAPEPGRDPAGEPRDLGDAADAAGVRYHRTRSCGCRTPSTFAARLREQGVWVTEKYYEGFGHMEPVIALGAMWRWRMPALDDMVEFFTRFGAFPSGIPRLAVVPDAAAGAAAQGETIDTMNAIVEQLDATFSTLN